MAIIFNRDGISLPVCQSLLSMLRQETERTGLDLGLCTQLTFNFRNPGYSAEQGGVHPVEIRRVRGLDDWLFDYVTDFSYQGLARMPSSVRSLISISSTASTICKAGGRDGWQRRESCSISGSATHRLLSVGVFHRRSQLIRRWLGLSQNLRAVEEGGPPIFLAIIVFF